MRLHKRSLVWGLALSGLAVVLAAAWWASQASREPALWSELRVPPAFAIPRDFDLGEYRLSWGGKSLVLSVAGSARPPLWESEGGFLGAGRESAGRLQLRCQEQSLESFELVGRRLSLKGHLRCADGRLSAYELSFEPRQGGVEVRVALADSELNRVALSWRRGAGSACPVSSMTRRKVAPGSCRPGSPATGVPLATPSSATRRRRNPSTCASRAGCNGGLRPSRPGPGCSLPATASSGSFAARVSRRKRAADPPGLAAAWSVRILCARSGRLSWPLLCQLSGEILPMQCRAGCGACCIAPSISSPLPGMPAGKPAGVRCLHLDENHLCGLFGRPERPAVCGQFGADPEICGDSREQALALIAEWEVITAA